MKKTVFAVGLALASGSVLAQGFDQSNLYVGGGLSMNSLSGFDDEMGYQAFVGYELDMIDLGPVQLAVEVGYFNSGKFSETVDLGIWGRYKVEADAKGVWTTAVGSYALSPEFSLIGRLGIDFGDDDGLMLGAGVGYAVSQQIEVRGEYVIRDNIDSLQANIVYRF